MCDEAPICDLEREVRELRTSAPYLKSKLAIDVAHQEHCPILENWRAASNQSIARVRMEQLPDIDDERDDLAVTLDPEFKALRDYFYSEMCAVLEAAPIAMMRRDPNDALITGPSMAARLPPFPELRRRNPVELTAGPARESDRRHRRRIALAIALAPAAPIRPPEPSPALAR